MKRTLPLLALATAAALAGGAAHAADNSIVASLYLPSVEVDFPPSEDASPDALQVEFRHLLNRNVWLGAMLTTGIGEDEIVAGTDIEIGTALTLMVGARAEFAHNVSGYAFLGYGKAEGSLSGASSGDADGNGVAWGLGVNFKVNDNMIVDAAYVSLFDGDLGFLF